MEGKRYKRSISGVAIGAWAAILLVLGMGLISPLSHDGEVNFVQDAEEVGTFLAGTSDVFHKTKVADVSINHNYPLITDVSSYSNYLHLMTMEQVMFNRTLGYAQVWTRLGDTGGTLFSDALLGYSYTVDSRLSSQEGLWENSEEFYKSLGETEHFRIFENRYGYEPGLKVKRSDYEALGQISSANVFEHQNLLSQLFFGTDMIETWSQKLEENGTTQCDIDVEGKKALYLYGNAIPGFRIKVNGEKVTVPSYEESDGTVYPSTLNNGILLLGIYEDEEVEVVLYKEVDWDVSGEVYFGMLDVEKFMQSTGSQESDATYEMGKDFCRMTTDSTGEEYLYLPVNADRGWHAWVNGSEREILILYGNLMLIPLDEGKNEIVLNYVPRGLKKGAMATAAAIVILGFWAVLSRTKMPDACLGWLYGKLSYAAAAVFFVVYLGFMLWLYVVPVGYTIYLKLMG